ncbi:hypothetical protein BGX24_007242, partial [Mortierella sp. AD032]
MVAPGTAEPGTAEPGTAAAETAAVETAAAGSAAEGTAAEGTAAAGSAAAGSAAAGSAAAGSAAAGTAAAGTAAAGTAAAGTAAAGTAAVEPDYLCNHRLKYNGGPRARMSHIEEHHQEIYQALKQFRRIQEVVQARNLATQLQEQSTIATPTTKGGYDGVRDDVLKIMQQATPEEQATFENYLLLLVARLNISFYAIDSDLFQAMFKHVNPSFKIPRTATLQGRLSQRVMDWKCDMIGKLPSLMYRGSITMDSWTDGTGDRKFLGITFHFMDKEYKMRTFVIGMVPMKKSQKADYLCSEV